MKKEKFLKTYMAQESERIIKDISLTEDYIALYGEREVPKRVTKRLKQLKDRLAEISL